MTQFFAKEIVIQNVHAFNGENFTTRDVVIRDGKIAADREADDVQIVDGQGRYLIPGLIDAHVHLRAEEQLEKLSAAGVTTALDMASFPPSLINSFRGKTGLTDIRSAGAPATSPGSGHSRMPGIEPYLISSPSEASRWVSDRIEEGADYIKVVADIPGPNQATLNAVISAAHEQGKLTIAHATRHEAFRMALEAKARVITHVPLDKPLNSDMVAQMVDGKHVSVPTLAICEALPKARGPPLNYEPAQSSLKALYEAGVPVLAGTDSNSSPICPVPHGESLHHELELLVEAGLSTVDALRAATSLPAKHFGLVERGEISEGFRADLVLLSADPLEDIQATRKIERIWINGIEYSKGQPRLL
ncbi:uncharacterized protein Z520_03931 [Fonsecaea multimorphosa CBS 102226]|uniref:Amidohydrolase-related domain-containing protein n=1 Tax=Fonsecaea multimorphosa CBS 102226 TaxID=1442371 RepID=A0A0D2HED0_9EURO|nr:uncharacterized protein Z520_03931 [Fonsecaea multimorphosa CBS 102226]KIY00246.1 hypothetical protein Z520_03931 [Fonsecaea multimorphosa CBS 102226]OAL27082.1 hypothetical protein AYO22_03713 [Fonsecaea multimorphosa]